MLWPKNGRQETRAGTPERRAGSRLDKVFPVYLEGDRGGALGVARNISTGGLFVETRAPQPIGSQVRITFPADGGDMTAIGEVRYVCHLLASAGVEGRGPRALRGMGVRFIYFEAGVEDAVATRH